MATMIRHLRGGLPALVFLSAFTVLTPALAQNGFGSSGAFTQNPEADRARPIDKPAGLPGARSTVAPAERTGVDLPPTEALFDAVNRGDIAAARDAISRGAQVDGRNILGLTPLELAIDLGRNDLTFLLLSMRGAAPAQRGAAPARTAAPHAAPRPAQAAVARPMVERAAAPRQRNADAVGTPVPQAGFLGFGSTQR